MCKLSPAYGHDGSNWLGFPATMSTLSTLSTGSQASPPAPAYK